MKPALHVAFVVATLVGGGVTATLLLDRVRFEPGPWLADNDALVAARRLRAVRALVAPLSW